MVNQNKISQNKNNNKDNIIAKLKGALIKRDSVNPSNVKETDLLGYFEGVLPTIIGHPDANLED